MTFTENPKAQQKDFPRLVGGFPQLDLPGIRMGYIAETRVSGRNESTRNLRGSDSFAISVPTMP